MDKDKIKIQGKIEISEEDFYDNNKPYIELTTRLCYLDYPNLNNVGLSSKSKEECFASIIDMPILAKIDRKGTGFKGHEVSKDKNGNIKFGTLAYGTNVDWYIQDDEVDIPNVGKKTVPCYFAKSKVWKRFTKVIEIIKKYTDGDGLYSSWELMGKEYSDEKGYKEYSDFVMLGNTLIGVQPAYGKNSKTLEVASTEDNFDIELSEALAQDIIHLSKKDNNDINKKEGGSLMAKKKIEESALNMTDLHKKLWNALNQRGWDSNPFYGIVEEYPTENKVLCRDYSSEFTDELIVFSYTIDEEENITLGEKTVRKLSELLAEKMNVNISMNLDDTAKLLSEKETKITELEKEISETKEKLTNTEKEFSEAGNAISELTKEKEQLEAEISELKPFKEKVEEMEKAEVDRQIAEKKEDLRKFALEDELISEQELSENETIANIFSELNLENYEVSQEKIELIKGRKALEKYKIEKSEKTNDNELETSESKENVSNVKTDLNNNEEGMLTAYDIVKSILNK